MARPGEASATPAAGWRFGQETGRVGAQCQAPWGKRPSGPYRLGRPIALAEIEHAARAAGHRGTGHSATVESLCNRVGGYAPDIRRRMDDILTLRALVSTGHAVTILPAFAGSASPEVAVRPIAEARCGRRSSLLCGRLAGRRRGA